MIKVDRGGEPDGLAAARTARLGKLPTDWTCPDRTRWFQQGYKVTTRVLHARQHSKCCYCEQIQVPIHNDVEHYRPWSRYWWLAWNWDNLLFACRACNQAGGKLDAFPLRPGSVALPPGSQPPGDEAPELLDPSVDDPRDHIRFELDPRGRWNIVGSSWRGTVTLHTLGLLRDEFRDLFNIHVARIVEPVIEDVRSGLATLPRDAFERLWARKCAELLDPHRAHRALSEDVLRHTFPSYPAPPP